MTRRQALAQQLNLLDHTGIETGEGLGQLTVQCTIPIQNLNTLQDDTPIEHWNIEHVQVVESRVVECNFRLQYQLPMMQLVIQPSES